MTQALSDLSVLAGRPADREPAGEDPEAHRSAAYPYLRPLENALLYRGQFSA